MGTNYYWYAKPDCPHCGRNDEPLHIGKSSGGWCFALHVRGPQDYEDDLPLGLDGWMERFRRDGSMIKDEYGCLIHPDDMVALIKREAPGWPRSLPFARNKVDGIHCVGHGPGPWDLIVGEFS